MPSLIQAIRARKEACGFSHTELDQHAGLTPGHASKIFCGDKNLGPLSFATLLAALGLKVAVIACAAPVPRRPKDKLQDRFPHQPPNSVEIAA